MSFRTLVSELSLVAGLVALAPATNAGSVSLLSGNVLGEVRDSAGVTQMGASVLLYNRYDELIRQTITNETGKFVFDGLAADLYTVRVVLASFMPAVRRNISVAAGSENLLRINLASIFSSIELVPAPAARGALMTDDWKWVLRASQSTRPVLRLAPVTSTSKRRSTTDLFTETTGIVRLSAGDGNTTTTAQDMGTAFALATVYRGATRVRLSGNVGYMANTGLPAAGFRTTYSREKDGVSGPQVSLTVHQIYFPGLAGYTTPGGDESGPALRSASLGTADQLQVSDQLKIEYGAHADSLAFLNRVTYLSPFARASYDLGNAGSLRLAFSSGTQPTELIAHDGEATGVDLDRDLAMLAFLPRVSRSGDRVHLERTENWEARYEFAAGKRKYAAAVYREAVSDASFIMSGGSGIAPQSELLPDFDSGNFRFDIGDYYRTGYMGAVTQSVGEVFDITVAAGRGGALIADSRETPAETGADIRSLIHKTQRTWATARASATLPGSGTHVTGSYGWTDFRALMPAHLSLTGTTYQDEGLNIAIRQPLPRLNGMRCRMEATAEMRNALAQGYLPLHAGGQSAVLTNSPRALRGGLNFLF